MYAGAVIAILLAGTVLRFFAIGQKPLWLDEAFSIWMAHHSLRELTGWLVHIDHHPPLYYYLLHVWQWVFGDWQATARSLSALCSSLALPIFFWTSRLLFNRRSALFATALLAFSPLHIRYAQEARMYALGTLAVAVLLYLLVRWLVIAPEQPGRRRILSLGLAVAQAAAMLTHNTATVLVPVTLNGAVLVCHYWGRRADDPASLPGLRQDGFWRLWWQCQLVALLLWLPWSLAFVKQVRVVDREFWIQTPTVDVVWETLQNFNYAHVPTWLPFAGIYCWLFWAAAVWAVVMWRRFPLRVLLLVLLFALPILSELLVSLRRPLFLERTLIWTTLPYYLLVAEGMSRWVAHAVNAVGKPRRQANWLIGQQFTGTFLGRAAGGLMVLIAASVLLGLQFIGLSGYYLDFEKEEWNKAARVVAAHASEGDVVLFNASWTQIPFEYYYRRAATEPVDENARRDVVFVDGNAGVGEAGKLPRIELYGMPVDLFARGVLEPKMTYADLPRLDHLIQGRQQVWLVYSHDWYTDPLGLIPERLSDRLELVDHRTLEGLRLLRYRSQ